MVSMAFLKENMKKMKKWQKNYCIFLLFMLIYLYASYSLRREIIRKEAKKC